MMKRPATALWPLATLLLILPSLAGNQTAREKASTPPVAQKAPKTSQIHGYTVSDDYFWLRDDKRADPEVMRYLKAENDYADAMTESSKGFRESLYKEMLGRIKETDEQVPYRQGDYFYYSRTEKGKQYPILCRKKGGLKAREEVTLDMNEMARGQKFFSLGSYEVSEDGNLLAFSTDTLGYRQYKLHVKDLRNGKITADIAERVTSVAWDNDARTIFYTQEDPVAKRSHKFFRTALGSGRHDPLFEEQDELYGIYCAKTRSKVYICLISASSTTSEVHYIAADRPGGPLELFLRRRENHEYYVDHSGDRFYIRTNDQGKNPAS